MGVRLFLDTSAFVKHYVDEPGGDEVDALLAEADSLTVSVLSFPECVSALQRLWREGRLDVGQADRLRAAMAGDLAHADICQIVADVVDAAVACLGRHRLRTLDALQLGSALVVGPDLFVSADRRQVEAAAKEGLQRALRVSGVPIRLLTLAGRPATMP